MERERKKPEIISGLVLSNTNGLELNFETGTLKIPHKERREEDGRKK